jgi:hypothetical protein
MHLVYISILKLAKKNFTKVWSQQPKKQADLNDQLEKGFITQEVYTARKAKLEAELARKKAEIEYKQAKREKQWTSLV